MIPEKLERCPNCDNRTDLFNYDFQICNACGWGHMGRKLERPMPKVEALTYPKRQVVEQRSITQCTEVMGTERERKNFTPRYLAKLENLMAAKGFDFRFCFRHATVTVDGRAFCNQHAGARLLAASLGEKYQEIVLKDDE